MKQFLAKYNITTHTIVGAIVFLIAAYHNLPAVHQFAVTLWGYIPAVAKESLTAVAAIVAFYWQGRKEWTPAQREEAQEEKAQAAAVGN